MILISPETRIKHIRRSIANIMLDQQQLQSEGNYDQIDHLESKKKLLELELAEIESKLELYHH